MIVFAKEIQESAKEFRIFFLMVVLNYKASSTQGCWCLPYSVLLICLKVIQGVPYGHQLYRLSNVIIVLHRVLLPQNLKQIGSGVGLVGLCLAHMKASKVILSDGDLSTLANMKFNLELNHLNIETDMPQGSEDPSM
ncbi:hypothetical protein S83_015688, partial [Arachis hypogaea]